MQITNRAGKVALLAWVLIAAPAGGAASAAENADTPVPAAVPKADTAPAPTPLSQSTQHQLRLDGQVIRYTATVGWLILKDDKDKAIARFGYTAYTLDGIKDATRRPITFAFNGGPGSSSIWLHLGVLGPRRVLINDAGYAPPPPAQLVDNEYSIIDATDLVMIDPVGTGFSKILGEAKETDFWGVDQDIKSVGTFIKRYVTENGRWGSPKYVLGESYGGMRGSGLAKYLQSDLGMNLNGLILVSPFFSLVSGDDGIGIDLPHVLYLSALASTAWYYDMIADKPASLEACNALARLSSAVYWLGSICSRSWPWRTRSPSLTAIDVMRPVMSEVTSTERLASIRPLAVTVAVRSRGATASSRTSVALLRLLAADRAMTPPTPTTMKPMIRPSLVLRDMGISSSLRAGADQRRRRPTAASSDAKARWYANTAVLYSPSARVTAFCASVSSRAVPLPSR